MKASITIALLLCQLALVSTGLAAEPAALTVTGNIANTNQVDTKSYVLSWKSLKQLPRAVVHTKTKWTPASDFTGVRISDILKAAGANPGAKTVTMQSIDNYMVAIPISDTEKWEVILAYSQNGKPFPKDKAPLWVIYPFDKHPAELNNDDTIGKSAWAVKGFIVQ